MTSDDRTDRHPLVVIQVAVVVAAQIKKHLPAIKAGVHADGVMRQTGVTSDLLRAYAAECAETDDSDIDRHAAVRRRPAADQVRGAVT